MIMTPEEKKAEENFLAKHNIALIPLPTPFPVGPVNTFLFMDGPITLVDTGLNTDDTYAELTRALKEHKLAISDIEVIIVTHGHRDHMGLLGRLMEETNAKAYGHPLVNKLGIHNPDDALVRKEFFIGILKEFGVPEETVEQANSLYDRFRNFSEPFALDYFIEDGGKTFEYDTFYVPGHSPSDTLFIDSKRGLTIVGDHILTSTNPNPLLRRPEPGEKRARSLVEYQASLRESRKRDLGVCLPGHGNLIMDGHAAIDRILSRHERRSAIVLKLVSEGRSTPFEISRKLFPELPAPHLHLGLSVSVGHLEVLEERGDLSQSYQDGILHFHPK
jgi:glyoxylase-like metal-dependent hydrolase (beta-lactamase superfamily II)